MPHDFLITSPEPRPLMFVFHMPPNRRGYHPMKGRSGGPSKGASRSCYDVRYVHDIYVHTYEAHTYLLT